MLDVSLDSIESVQSSLGYSVNPLIKNKYKTVNNSDAKLPMVIP